VEEPSAVDDEHLREVAQAAEAMLMIENAPLPLAVVLPNARIALTNKALADLLGYSPDELSGANVRQILADTSDFDERWGRAINAVGVTDDREGRLRRRDGGHVRARVASLVINGDDGRPRFILARALSTRQEKAG
jgi:PAS domain S-box-containing protein